MSKFATLIQTPTEDQKDRIFWYPWFWWSDGMIDDILQTFLKQPTDEKNELIQETVSKLLNNLSISERYKFKKMIVDVIKEDFSYSEKLTRQLNLTRNALTRSILEWKIKIIEEDIDRLEVPTWNTKEYHLKKYRPYFLPDHSIHFSFKDRTLTLKEIILFYKDLHWGNSIHEITQRQRELD